MKYSFLGPYPGNGSYSIGKYFDFYRQNLAPRFGADFLAACPGGSILARDGSIWQAPRYESWWNNYIRWPHHLGNLRGDLFHIADQGLFWYARFLHGGKRLGTVHDLIAYLTCSGILDLPSASRRRKMIVGENIRQLVKLDHIISVSEFTAGSLMRELGIPPSRITVVHNHVDNRFVPPTATARTEHRRKWFDDADHVVIHVGRPVSYKNRLGAIKAFALLHKRVPAARMFLVNGACTQAECAFIASGLHSAAIRFIPAVTVDELTQIYGAADVLIFPSYYEGFGWPPLEAMACGCPVVSSTRASLREVVGDAALTAEDPDDHERLAALLHEIITSAAMARDLRARGFARVRLFTPEKALNEVSGVYRMLA